MPNVDVSDLLLDPDVAGQQFVVVRRAENVNEFGESAWTYGQATAIGAIQPSGDQGLMRGESFDAQAKSVVVYTRFRLRGVNSGASGASFKPDIVLWNGVYYEVTNIDSYGSFGAGFVKAECTSISNIDLPTLPNIPRIARLDFSDAGNAGLADGA